MSKRGVGVSLGVRGLRLGTGPRGTYVRGGRGGFYYQQYLRSKTAALPSAPQGVHYPPAGTSTEFIADPSANGDDAIAQINHRRRAFRWSIAVISAVVLCAVWVATANIGAVWYAPLVAALVYGGVLHSRENAHRAIAFHYDLEGDVAAEYGRLAAAFRDAARSVRIWRVVSQNLLGDRKHNAGATSSVERVPTAVTFGGGGALATNIDVPSLDVQGTRVYFLPDRILTIAGSRLGSVAYVDLRAEDSQTRFSENEALPADATRVGTTWLYVNKNGSADKRFNNNRQLPIALYSDLRILHPALTLTIEFSRSDAAGVLASALRRFVKSMPSAPTDEAARDPHVPGAEVAVPSSIPVVDQLVQHMSTPLAPLRSAHTAESSEPVASDARRLDAGESLAWITARSDELQRFMPLVLALCSTELQPALAPLPDGTASEAAQDTWMASCVAMCTRLTAWEADVRSVAVALLFHEAQRLMRGLTTEYMEAIERVPEQLRAAADGSGDGKGVQISITMARLAPLNAELARLQSLFIQQT